MRLIALIAGKLQRLEHDLLRVFYGGKSEAVNYIYITYAYIFNVYLASNSTICWQSESVRLFDIGNKIYCTLQLGLLSLVLN